MTIEFTKADADLVARHQADLDKLASHNRATSKSLEDEKERRRKFQATQEGLVLTRQKLETQVMNSGEAYRKLETCVPRELTTAQSQAAVEARQATQEAIQARGRVATAALNLDRLTKSGADAQTLQRASEGLTRANCDLVEAGNKVQKFTEKALKLDLEVNKAKEAILAHARRTA